MTVTSYAEFRRLLGEAEVKRMAEQAGFNSQALTGKNRRALRDALLRKMASGARKKDFVAPERHQLFSEGKQ